MCHLYVNSNVSFICKFKCVIYMYMCFCIIRLCLPGVVMPWICPYSTSEARHGPIQFLGENILVSQEGVSVGKR